MDDYVFVDVRHPGVGPRYEAPYQNYLYAERRSLLCINNFANRDHFYGTPERIFWSDIMAVSCSWAATVYDHGRKMKDLETNRAVEHYE